METGPGVVTAKQRVEREFHDRWARGMDASGLLVDEAFEACTAMENRYALEALSPAAGCRLLDLGCGAGETSVYFAKRGAKVTALDISPEMVALGRSLAARHKTAVDFMTGAAEKLPFPDGSFDAVFCNGVLHHVDLLPALHEVRRVLRPGGKAAFIEPLKHNPLIGLYRRLAGESRTPTERPLGFADIQRMRQVFPVLDHREFWLFTLYLFVHFFLFERVSPSKVRYWKKVIEDAPRYERLFGALKRLDDAALCALPFLSRLCWNTVIVVEREA